MVVDCFPPSSSATTDSSLEAESGTPLSLLAEAFEELARTIEGGDVELRLGQFSEACSFVSVLFVKSICFSSLISIVYSPFRGNSSRIQRTPESSTPELAFLILRIGNHKDTYTINSWCGGIISLTRGEAATPAPMLALTLTSTGGIDFRSTDDDAWWQVKLSPGNGGDALRVSYCGFSEAADEWFEVDGFRSAAEVEEFASRFRLTPEQLQDSDCHQVIAGMKVCASHKFTKSDVKFYDAVLEEVKFSKHKQIRRKEICTCSFVVLWQHGPMVGEKTSIGIESICLLRSQDSICEPVLDHFLHMAKKKFKTANSIFGQTDNKIKLRKHGRDFSNIGVACSSGKLSSEIDDNQSKKPAPSPSPIEPETFEPVWTYSHALRQPTNPIACSFCGRAYPCSTKLNCHLACIGGNTEPCPSVPIYWQVFYARYLHILTTTSSQKPQDIVAAEILKKLDAETVAGHITCPPDRVTVKEGSSNRDQTKEDEGVMSECSWWKQKLRKVLQRCFKQYDIPGCIVADPDFIAACHQIAAAAKAGHDKILPSEEDMDIWIPQESGDEIY